MEEDRTAGDADRRGASLDLDTLDAERWAAIDRVLEIALELPPEEVEAALDRLCAGDGRLRAQVQALIRADRSSMGFLVRSALGLLKPGKRDGEDPLT